MRIEFPKLADGWCFGSMYVHAESWAVWEELPEEDGWEERALESEGGIVSVYKTLGAWPNGYIAAFPPSGRRPRDRIAAIYGMSEQVDEVVAVRSRAVPDALRRDVEGTA